MIFRCDDFCCLLHASSELPDSLQVFDELSDAMNPWLLHSRPSHFRIMETPARTAGDDSKHHSSGFLELVLRPCFCFVGFGWGCSLSFVFCWGLGVFRACGFACSALALSCRALFVPTTLDQLPRGLVECVWTFVDFFDCNLSKLEGQFAALPF